MSDVQIDISTSQAQQAVVLLDAKLRNLRAELTVLEGALEKQGKALSDVSRQYKDLTTATAASNASLSSLTSAVKGETTSALKSMAAVLDTQYTSMTKLASSTDIYYGNMVKLTSTIITTKTQIAGLNTAFAEKAALQGKLNLLSNESYVSMVKESNAIKDQIKLKEVELGISKASAVSKEKESKESLALAAALDRENAARLKLGLLSNAGYVNSLRTTKELDRQTSARMQALGLIDKEAVGTKNLDEAQKALHQTARGLSGAMGSLWLTYGQPMAPMVAGFVAAAAAVNSIKISSEVEYTTKLIETLSKSFGESGESATELRDSLHSIKDSRQGIDQLALGLKEFVKAGVEGGLALKHLEEMSRFATIAEVDMAAAVKLVVANSNAFGEDFTAVANKVSAAAFATTADIKDLGLGLSYATPLGSVLGLSLTEVSTALGLLAQKGIDGSKAGTSLTTTLMRLAAPTENAKKVMQELGVEFSAFGSDGKIKSIKQQLTELSKIFSGLSEEKAIDLMGALSDLRSMKGLGNLIQDMGGDGKAWDSLYSKIEGAANGITLLKQTSADLDETVTAKWDKLIAKFKALGDSEFLSDFVSVVLSRATDVTNAVDMIVHPVDTYVKYVGEPFEKAVDATVVGFKKLVGIEEDAQTFSSSLTNMSDQAAIAAAKLEQSREKMAPEGPQVTIFETLGIQPLSDDVKKQLEEMKSAYIGVASLAASIRAEAALVASLPREEQKQLDMNELMLKGQGLNELEKKKVEIKHEHIAALEKALAVQKKLDAVTGTDNTDKLTKAYAESEESAVKKAIEADQKRLQSGTNTANSLQQKYQFLSTYVQNLDETSTASKLANIEKKYTADKQYIEQYGKDSRDAQVALTQLEMWRASETEKINSQLEEKKKAIREKATDAYENDLVYLENLDNETLAGKLARIDKELQTKLSAIDAAKLAGMGELDADKAKTAAMEVETHKRGLLYKKQDADRKEFYDGIKTFRQELSGGSELEDFISGGDTKIDKMFDSFKKGASAQDIAAATTEVAKLKKELRDSDKAAILGDDPFKGFMAGVREAQRETGKLGKLGAEVGKEFQSALASSFKELFFGKNKNKYTDQITTISEKIKEMQYGSLKDGASQLAYLREEYDTTLTGAMKGNKDMFESYMSNLDTYLDKAKEEMSPEEYERVYAQTMADLDRLNNEYAGKTENVWDRLGDVWDDFTGKIVDKWMDAVAEIAANEIIFQITGKSTMSGALSGIFGGSGGSGGGSGIIGSAAGGAWDFVSDWWNSTGSSWTDSAGTWVDEISSWAGYGADSWYGANGGYIGGHPKGGVIRAGSGVSDDVFLGYTDGGATANYGMGGEYIINKKSTAKYLPVLEKINSEGYASGGQYGSKDEIITKFSQLGDSMLASGMSADEVKTTLTQMMSSMRRYNQVMGTVASETSNGLSSMADASEASTSALNSETKAKAEATAAAGVFSGLLGTIASKGLGPLGAALAKTGAALATSEKGVTLAEGLTALAGALASVGLSGLGPLGALVGLVSSVTGFTGVLQQGLLSGLNSVFGTTSGTSDIASELSVAFSEAVDKSFTQMDSAFADMASAESFADAEAAVDAAVSAMEGFADQGLPGVLGDITSHASSLGDVSDAFGVDAAFASASLSETTAATSAFSADMMSSISGVLGDMEQAAAALQGAVSDAESAAAEAAAVARGYASAAAAAADSVYQSAQSATVGLGDADIDSSDRTNPGTPGGIMGSWGGGDTGYSEGAFGSAPSSGPGSPGDDGGRGGGDPDGDAGSDPNAAGGVPRRVRVRRGHNYGPDDGEISFKLGEGVVSERGMDNLAKLNSSDFLTSLSSPDFVQAQSVPEEAIDLNDPEIKSILLAIATHVKKSSSILQRFEYTGIPTAITPARG